MCLAIPGKILTITDSGDSMPVGRVSFSGVIKTINLVYTPAASIGDYVLVHVGFAISIINQAEADMIFTELQRLGELEELSG